MRTSRVPVRAAIVSLVLLGLLLLAPPSGRAQAASRPTASAIASYIDRTLRAWEPQVQRDGEVREPLFYDEAGGERYPAYGTPMIGYAFLRAGLRSGNDRWVELGLRSVTYMAQQATPSPFDAWAVVTAFAYAEDHLRRDARYVAVREYWLAYLRGWRGGSSEVEQCYTRPACFNNWKLVDALASARILRLGVSSAPATLRDHVVRFVNGMAVASAGPPLRAGGLRARVLSDPPTNPLAYHALSTGLLQQIEAAARSTLSPAARKLRADAARFALLASAPDGDISYMGRSAQQSWTLAASMLVGTTAMASDRPHAGRWQRMVDQAWAKLRTYPVVDGGLIAITPSITSLTYDGLDAYAGMAVYNGLTLFHLQETLDRMPARRPRVTKLPAERGQGFSDLGGSAVSVVAGRDAWVAVQGRQAKADPRLSAGILQAKVRRGSRWVDLTPGRPSGVKAAPHWGPQLIRGGKRLPMTFRSARVRGTQLVARGGFHSAGGIVRGTTFRVRVVGRKIVLSFSARKGDRFVWTEYLASGWVTADGFQSDTAKIRFNREGFPHGLSRPAPTALAPYAESHEWSVRLTRDGTLRMTLSR